ncbi:DUF3084 domain-containing protein [bacterium]|nr:DUF3084 domain-containing protein [bacterium]
MYSWLLIGMLLLVSGLIAFLGDFLGRKLGKKRVSLIRLRPRYTAIVFSVITGIFISLFTLLVLSKFSYPVRVALFGVESLLQERNTLEKEVAKLRKTQAKLTKEIAERNEQLSKVEKKAKEQSEKLSQLSFKVSSLMNAKKRLESYLDKAGKELRRLTNELGKTKRELASISIEYRKALTALEESKNELEKNKKELTTYAQRLRDTQGEIQRLTNELRNLEATRKELSNTVAKLRAERDNLERDLEQLRVQNESLRGELAKKEQEVLAVASYYGEVLGRELIYPKGKEVIRGIIECGRPADRIKVSLRSLIKLASDEAIKKGAGTGADGKAVSLMKFIEGRDGIYVFPEESVLEGVAMKLSQMQGSVVARLVALRNFTKGEQIVCDLELYRNSLVFDKGEVIATTILDGRSSESELLEKVIAFLRKDVREKALERGLIPGEDETVGELSLKDIINTIASVKENRGKVLLKAVATKRIYSANPLSITLQVSEASS